MLEGGCEGGGYLCACMRVFHRCSSSQSAGESSIANLDRLYHSSDGETHTAELRLNMQRVSEGGREGGRERGREGEREGGIEG